MGRPAVRPDIRTLIRDMSNANPRWGAPRIHGELLKLGIDVSQATDAKLSVASVSTSGSLARSVTCRLRSSPAISAAQSTR
jgi:hypothetical protein